MINNKNLITTIIIILPFEVQHVSLMMVPTFEVQSLGLYLMKPRSSLLYINWQYNCRYALQPSILFIASRVI
jgi:hypothetical protein